MKVYNNPSGVSNVNLQPIFYEDKNYLYINGKKYNKDFTITDFDTIPFVFDNSLYNKKGKYSILTYNRYSNCTNANRDNSNLYPFSMYDMVLDCGDDGVYCLIMPESGVAFTMIHYSKSGDFIEKKDFKLSASTYRELKNAYFIGQSLSHIYIACIYLEDDSSCIFSLPKNNLNANLTTVTSSAENYSENIQKLFETEYSVFLIRDTGFRGGTIPCLCTKNGGNLSIVKLKTTMSTSYGTGYLRCLHYPYYSTNSKIYMYAIQIDTSRVDSFRIYYREISKDAIIQNDTDNIIVSEDYCIVSNGDLQNIFSDYKIDILNSKHVLIKGTIEHYNGNRYMHFLTGTNSYSVKDKKSDSVITFKINDFNNLEYIGTTKLPSASSMPAISLDNTLFIPNTSSILMLKQSTLTNKYEIVSTIDIPSASISIDENNRIFAVDYYGNLHLLNDSMVYDIDIQLYTPSLVYNENDIESYVTVDAYNHNGNRISVDVSLEITGPGVFSNNNSTITLRTSTNESIRESVTINGCGVLKVDGSVVI